MESRREFIRSFARGGGLLAVGGVATLLGWRSIHGNCTESHPCAKCPRFSGCELPQAAATRTPEPTAPAPPPASPPPATPPDAGRPI